MSDLDVRWIHGSPTRRGDTDPPLQVHAVDDRTWIVRQSMAVHREAPFLYLFAGDDRALLLDTGATKDPDRFPLRRTVDGLIGDAELVVAHTHGHYDHVDGDGQFADRPRTTVVGKDVGSVRAFFELTGWPDQIAKLDLGGRVLEVFGGPGHQEAAIFVHDPRTRFLVTGDTVYPGRLYIEDAPVFLTSLERAVAFTTTREVSHVMGCHVEMTTTPGRDYPMGAIHQPDEAALPMTVAQLVAVRDAARATVDRPGVHVYDDFILYNGPCRTAVAKQVLRTVARRLTRR